jgi:hypothetical protein
MYTEVNAEFTWHPGLAVSQKQKSIASLHNAIKGPRRILEVSTKSALELGCALSAFNLSVDLGPSGALPVEVRFQAAKVFEQGGPFLDLMQEAPADARRDRRLKTSGPLVAFECEGERWRLTPRSMFYDWLFLRGLTQSPDRLLAILRFDAFTDIEFNPKKSVNCQARACAICVGLSRAGRLAEVVAGREAYQGAAEMIYGALANDPGGPQQRFGF